MNTALLVLLWFAAIPLAKSAKVPRCKNGNNIMRCFSATPILASQYCQTMLSLGTVTVTSTPLETQILYPVVTTEVDVQQQTQISTQQSMFTITEYLTTTTTVIDVVAKRQLDARAAKVIPTSLACLSKNGKPRFKPSAIALACDCIGMKSATVTATAPTSTITQVFPQTALMTMTTTVVVFTVVLITTVTTVQATAIVTSQITSHLLRPLSISLSPSSSSTSISTVSSLSSPFPSSPYLSSTIDTYHRAYISTLSTKESSLAPTSSLDSLGPSTTVSSTFVSSSISFAILFTPLLESTTTQSSSLSSASAPPPSSSSILETNALIPASPSTSMLSGSSTTQLENTSVLVMSTSAARSSSSAMPTTTQLESVAAQSSSSSFELSPSSSLVPSTFITFVSSGMLSAMPTTAQPESTAAQSSGSSFEPLSTSSAVASTSQPPTTVSPSAESSSVSWMIPNCTPGPEQLPSSPNGIWYQTYFGSGYKESDNNPANPANNPPSTIRSPIMPMSWSSINACVVVNSCMGYSVQAHKSVALYLIQTTSDDGYWICSSYGNVVGSGEYFTVSDDSVYAAYGFDFYPINPGP